MADPEDLIRQLPEESPPPEIVRAALRVFRYRAIAVMAASIAIIVVGVPVAQSLLRPSSTDAEVAAARAHGSTQTIAQMRTVAGVNVLLWEVIVDGPTAWVHTQAWDPRNRQFAIQVTGVTLAGHAVPPLAGGGGGSACCSPSSAESWDSFQSLVKQGHSILASVTVQVLGGQATPPGSSPPVLGSTTFHFTLFGGLP